MNSPDISWTCPSCGAEATGRYCGVCGERALIDSALSANNDASARPGTSFIARLHASLRALASPPGKLTADWALGRRIGYLPPLSLFLWANVAFFLVQSASGLGVLTWPLHVHLSDDLFAWLTTRLLAFHVPRAVTSTATYTGVFDALESVHAKSLVLVMVPAFALVLHALLLDRRGSFRSSLTFSTHFFTFALIWLCALFPAVAVVLRLVVPSTTPGPWQHSMDLAVTALEAAVLAWYLYVALNTVFGLSWVRRAVMVAVLVAALYGILKAYHVVVFAVTLYSI